MSVQQIRKDLSGIRGALKPADAAGKIIIYDRLKGIPEELLKGDTVRVFIPDNGRDPGISQLC